MKAWLEHRYLPVILALGAILLMLPAFKAGLFMDDLVQRAVELKPEQLPAHLTLQDLPLADCGRYDELLAGGRYAA